MVLTNFVEKNKTSFDYKTECFKVLKIAFFQRG